MTESRQNRRSAWRAAWLFAVCALACSALSACGAPSWQNAPHDRFFQRAQPPTLHRAPKELEASDWWESFYNGSFEQFGKLVSPGHYAQTAFSHEAAFDTNQFGQVPDSSWFENRLGRRRMSSEAVRRGPCTDAPAPGRFQIKSGKTEGATPGLVVKDSAGQGWVVKFDPPAYPELSSAAEAIATRLLYAAGYNVPENQVVYFDLERLVASPGATTKDRYGRKVPFTKALVRRTLAQLNPGLDGRVRALFSKYLPGKPVGPFPLRGTRLDDPNDRIPHERRRSLRGLWVFYAWLNNTDAKMPNTLDVFIEPEGGAPGLGYVKHFLLDFGTSLGAGATGPKAMTDGYAYLVDWENIFARTLTLGIDYPYWVVARRTPLRSVGQFESRVFDPAKWRPMYPNTPFDRADALDTFWAASILARFDAHAIEAAVAAGEYSDPVATAWVARVLIERQHKLLRHAFRDLLPLDFPRLESERILLMDDLEVASGLRNARAGVYPWRLLWHRGRQRIGVVAGSAPEPRFDVGVAERAVAARFGAGALGKHPFVTLQVSRAESGAKPEFEPRVDVHLRWLPGSRWIAVGLDRVAD